MQDLTKTTLSDLLAGTTPQTKALLANSTDEILYVESGNLQAPLTPPRVGDYWHGQGGYYAGIMRDGDRQWHLIDSGQFITAAWGRSRNKIPGTFSVRDGRNNTNLILAAEPENKIASHCTALLIDGHKDFYWPSQCENNLLIASMPEHHVKEVNWSSTQYSNEFAWGLYPHDFHQIASMKDNRHAARAARRVLIA